MQGQIEVLKWCTVNRGEQEKCLEMSRYVDQELIRFGKVAYNVSCVQVRKPFKSFVGWSITELWNCLFSLLTKLNACSYLTKVKLTLQRWILAMYLLVADTTASCLSCRKFTHKTVNIIIQLQWSREAQCLSWLASLNWRTGRLVSLESEFTEGESQRLLKSY